jgi:hypothetical protein
MQKDKDSTPGAGGLIQPSIASGAASIQWVIAVEDCIVIEPESFPVMGSVRVASNIV